MTAPMPVVGDEPYITPGDANNSTQRPQVWDYDTGTATVAELTRRWNLMTTRLRILAYLPVH